METTIEPNPWSTCPAPFFLSRVFHQSGAILICNHFGVITVKPLEWISSSIMFKNEGKNMMMANSMKHKDGNHPMTSNYVYDALACNALTYNEHFFQPFFLLCTNHVAIDNLTNWTRSIHKVPCIHREMYKERSRMLGINFILIHSCSCDVSTVSRFCVKITWQRQMWADWSDEWQSGKRKI